MTVWANKGIARRSLGGLAARSAMFAIGAVGGKTVGFLLLPFFTRLLSPAAIGELDVLMSLGSAATATLLLGLDTASLRLYFDAHDDSARRRIASTWFLLAVIASGGPALVLITLAMPASNLIFGTTPLELGIVAVAAVIVAQTMEVVGLTVLRAEQRAGTYMLISVGVAFLYGLLAVSLVLVWRRDAVAVVAAWACALAVGAVVALWTTKAVLGARPSQRTAELLVRMGLPLVPAAALSAVGDFANRAVLLSVGGATEVGFLTIAARIASVASLAAISIQLAWQPHAFALDGTDESVDRTASVARNVLILISFIVIALAAVAKELLNLVAGDAYLLALPALSFSLSAALAAGVFMVASTPHLVRRDTRIIGFAAALGTATGVLMNALLAARTGSAGAAAGVALGQTVAVVALLRGDGVRDFKRLLSRNVAIMLVLASAMTVTITDTAGLPMILRLFIPATLGIWLARTSSWGRA